MEKASAHLKTRGKEMGWMQVCKIEIAFLNRCGTINSRKNGMEM